MDKYKKVCYDLALIYTLIKYKSVDDRGIIGQLHPGDEPNAEIQCLVDFFNDSYSSFRELGPEAFWSLKDERYE